MIKTVCDYAHKKMSNFSIGNYSRTGLMPLAAIVAMQRLMLLPRQSLLFLPILLSGCVSVPVSTEDQQFNFSVQGKLLVFHEQEKTSLRFFWRQAEDAYRIDVWGNFGQGRLQLRGDTEEMMVLRGDDIVAIGKPEEVMRKQLGWGLPVAAIPHWLFGRPLPNSGYEAGTDSAANWQSQFVQLGWAVLAQFKPYPGEQGALPIIEPVQLTLERGSTRAKVLVSKFRRNGR
jgi:outer membrane lipoprotein LolB